MYIMLNFKEWFGIADIARHAIMSRFTDNNFPEAEIS